MVHEAAAQAASMARTYDETVLPWLEDHEQRVLIAIAAQPVRSSRSLQGVLRDESGDELIREAFARLQNMGLITAKQRRPGRPWPLSLRRHRVAIPLLGTWLRQHVELPAPRRQAIQERRWRAFTIGLVITAVLGGIYLAFWNTGRELSAPQSDGPCMVRVDHPAIAAPDDAIRVYVFRTCVLAPVAQWDVRSIDSPAEIRYLPAAAKGGAESTTNASAWPCPPESSSCTAHLDIKLFDSAQDSYRFAVTADQRLVVQFSVAKDASATIKRQLEGAVQVIAALPLLFGLFIALFGDIASAVRRLRSVFRGVGPARFSMKSTRGISGGDTKHGATDDNPSDS